MLIDPQAGKVPMMRISGIRRSYFAIHHMPAETAERITSQKVSNGLLPSP